MQIRNSIHLIGHLGQDAELRNTKNGESFLKFSLATTEYSRDKEGNQISRTEWHKVLIFGKERAKALQDKLKKGTLIAVNGVLRYSRWTDKNEQLHIDAAIHLSDFAFLAPAKERSEEQAA